MVTAQQADKRKPSVATTATITGAKALMNGVRSVARRLGETEADGCSNIHRDPLAHPALQAMTSRELADLPFPRPTQTSLYR
jgi:hypothetical protein